VNEAIQEMQKLAEKEFAQAAVPGLAIAAVCVRGKGIFKRSSIAGGTAKATSPDAAASEFAGLVDVGNGRKIYLECRGAGSPTVIFESGYRNDADIWSTETEPGSVTVFPEVAKFTHVCAYD
jgi:hypothetical protein